MKIAIIHSHLNGRGGSQRYVVEITRNLLKLGVKVDLYAYEYNKKTCYPELLGDLNVNNVFRSDEQSGGFRRENSLFFAKRILKYFYSSSLIAKKIVDAVGLDYLYRTYQSLRMAKRIMILLETSGESYDLVFAHEEPVSLYAAILYKIKSKTPIYWFCYDTIEKWFLEWTCEHKESWLRGILLRRIYFRYDRYLVRKYVDLAAVLDEKMAARYERLYGIKPLIRRGGITAMALNYSRENDIRRRYGIGDDVTVLFCLSRFIPYRRVHDIFEIYNALPLKIKSEVFILINAPVNDDKYYRWCMEKYGDIINTGKIVVDTSYPANDTEMYQMYLSADIFLFPNENQTWGHAPLEAMACQVAALVSDGCGISEEILKISPLTVFSTGNIAEAVNALEYLHVGKRYKEVGLLQKVHVKKNLTWDIISMLYIKDFESVVGVN
jgi:glycosyltransferase involved in cell wall biosynthesis